MISVALMCHPKRERWIPELADSIDAEPTVVWDRHNDRWDTGRRSLLAYDPDASHHLVVQDDAIVCRDLIAGLEQAVVHTGEHPVGLYMGMVRPSARHVQSRIEQAKVARSRWVKMDGPWWGVGILIPTAHIDDLVKWGDQRADIANYDKRISRWYVTVKGLKCLYPQPSLVEHRHGGENPSLIPGRTGTTRRAHSFIGADTSALDIDWSGRTDWKEHGMVTFRNLRSPHLDPVTVADDSKSARRLNRLPGIWERIDDRPAEKPSEPTGSVVDVSDLHTGAGWYTLPDGTRVRGKAAAEARLGETA